MLEPIYCPSCRKPVEPSWANCPHCGARQKQDGNSPALPPHAMSSQPMYVVQQVANPQIILNECTRQYRNLSWLAFAGIFLLGAYFIGLAMIIYAMVQKPALRRKVAEMGVDPETWEAPLRQEFGRIMVWGVVGCIGVAVVSVLIFVFFLRFTPTPQ